VDEEEAEEGDDDIAVLVSTMFNIPKNRFDLVHSRTHRVWEVRNEDRKEKENIRYPTRKRPYNNHF